MSGAPLSAVAGLATGGVNAADALFLGRLAGRGAEGAGLDAWLAKLDGPGVKARSRVVEGSAPC